MSAPPITACPRCGSFVEGHCDNNPVCNWWRCKRCAAYGDHTGRWTRLAGKEA